MSVMSDIKIRPLERGDLHFVHKINNNDVIMRYWFEEPYEAYDELVALYDRHLHDQNERRFIIERDTGEPAGWSSWSRSTISTAARNSRSSSRPATRGAATPRRPRASRWAMLFAC